MTAVVIAVVVVAVTIVEVGPVVGDVIVLARVVESTSVVVVIVVTIRPPLSVGIAYGGSKRPSLPQALQGEAHCFTVSGARRLKSQCPSGIVVATMAGSIDWGQFVYRSLRVSCRVICPSGNIVDISFRSAAKTSLVPEGPARPREFVPYMVLITK